MAKLTPMMRQYMDIKKRYKDCILFYHIDDFYEMFFEGAIICSRKLEIDLTGKYVGQEERAPMCGLSCQNIDNYLNRLIEKVYRVGICEQMEDPKDTKGIVKREVIRIVTPDESNKYSPSEIICDSTFMDSKVDVSELENRLSISVSEVDKRFF